MNKPNLNKFFSGKFSDNEKQHLKHWIEEDMAHYEEFLKERNLYNLSLLNSNNNFLQDKTNPKFFQLKRLFFKLSGLVAIFFLGLLFSYHIWDNYRVSHSDTPIVYHTISVPYGQRVNLTLPDSSKIWLNAGTTIKYPISFDEKDRKVFLQGEAYFEVQRKKHIPFYVMAGEHSIEVLGTEFNVEVDVTKNKFETILVKGAVKVYNSSIPDKSILLKPNSSVSLVDGELHVKPVHSFDNLLWREGFLCFDKSPFGDMMNDFEKAFGYKIVLNNQEVTRYLYTGKFRQVDGIDYALNLLQKSMKFTYSRVRDENTIVIN